ncbi:CHAD domain-containing protein [Amycolatopsis pigmentata]|uniref:CHAD domain-containing protein n=1 Tax=Amycolatopsis pigmentata TaxID=450801 RepID=A0ABW5G571_9PSEU
MSAETLPAAAEVRSPADLGLGDEPRRAGPQDTSQAHLRAKLDAELRVLLATEAGTRSGRDPEDLHQMRVAVRRMRSVLRVAEGRDAETVRAELKWLGTALGEVRDYDVLIAHLRDVVDRFDDQDREPAALLIALFDAERAEARRRMNQALGSSRYDSLLIAIAELSRDAEVRSTPETSRLDAAQALRKPYRKLTKAAKRLPEIPSDAELHALRIRGKRLRYAAEMATPAAGKKQAKRLGSLVKAAKKLQDVLGDHQDAVVAAARVRAVAALSGAPPVDFVAGRVVEHETCRRTEARSVWPDALAAVSALASRMVA